MEKCHYLPLYQYPCILLTSPLRVFAPKTQINQTALSTTSHHLTPSPHITTPHHHLTTHHPPPHQQLRVFAPETQINQTALALKVCASVINTYESIFDIKFPMSKLGVYVMNCDSTTINYIGSVYYYAEYRCLLIEIVLYYIIIC